MSRGPQADTLPGAGHAGSPAAMIARQGGRVLSSQAAVALLSVAFTMVLARLLSKAEFATFGVYSLLCALTDAVASLGLESSALQLVPSRGAAQGRALLRAVLGSRIVASAVVAAMVCAAAAPLSRCLMKSPAYAPAIRCMAAGTFAFSLFQGLQLLGQAAQEFGAISAWTTASAVLQRMFAIGLFFALGLEGYLAGLAAGQLLAAAGLAWSLRRHFSAGGEHASWSGLARRSWPFYARGFARFGFLQADQAVVALALNPEIFATYALCRQLAAYVRSAAEAFLMPTLVKAAALRHAARQRLERAFTRVSRYTLLGAAPLCCAAALGSRGLLALFGGGKYDEGWPMLALLCGAQLLYLTGSVYGLFLFAVGSPAQTLRLDCAAGCLALLATTGAVALAGARGAALAQVLSFALLLLLARRFASQVVPCSFDWSVGRMLALPLAAGSGLVAALEACFYSPALVPLYLAAGGVVFLLLLLPRLTAEDWATLSPASPRLARWLSRASTAACES